VKRDLELASSIFHQLRAGCIASPLLSRLYRRVVLARSSRLYNHIAADVRKIGALKRDGIRPTSTQLGHGFPSGFGVRQSSAAFPPDAQPPSRCWFSVLDNLILPKRQRTAAVQDAVARIRPPGLIGPYVGGLHFLGMKCEPSLAGGYDSTTQCVIARELIFRGSAGSEFAQNPG
jgi:hypothetical protein